MKIAIFPVPVLAKESVAPETKLLASVAWYEALSLLKLHWNLW
jgi:hypothetical protein